MRTPTRFAPSTEAVLPEGEVWRNPERPVMVRLKEAPREG